MSPKKKIVSVKVSKKRNLHIPKRSSLIRHREFITNLENVAAEKNLFGVSTLLKNSTPGQLKALVEIAQNLLKRNYPKTEKRFLKKLIPHKGIIRKLASRKIPIKSKRALLLRKSNQSGGLPFLVPLLAPIVTSLISAGIQAAI